jgi:hypothetical protein
MNEQPRRSEGMPVAQATEYPIGLEPLQRPKDRGIKSFWMGFNLYIILFIWYVKYK